MGSFIGGLWHFWALGWAAGAAIMPTRKPYQANDKDRGKLEVLLEMDVPLQQIAQKIGVSIPTP